MARDRDIKKSNFVEVLSAISSDRFDFTRGQQNLKISLENLLASMGVSGALTSVGEVTSIPVLNVVGGVNYIRSILAGAGILVSVSPQNGIQLDHNFTVDKTGVPIMLNEGAASPTFRSIEAGSGISVAANGNKVQISYSATPVSTKTVNVYELADLPAPVAGVITLADDTEYRFLNDVSSINRYILGNNTVISGADEVLIILEYTGAGNMLTAVDKEFTLRNIHFQCSAGTLFDISSTTGLHCFQMMHAKASVNNVGTIDNMRRFYLHGCEFTVTTQGFVFAGNFEVLLIDMVCLNIASGTGNGITLGTATFDYLTISNFLADINTSGYLLSGLANSGNINAAGLGTVLNSINFGTATASDNISPFDNRWESQLNAKLLNSFDLCLVSHAGATIAISAAATPVIIGATWTSEDLHRFTATAGGRFTYTGKGTHVSINASISATIVTATDDVSFYIYKNGVQIANSRITRAFSAGSLGNVVLVWDLILATNDYLELWVANDDTTVDVIIDNIILSVRS